MQGEITTQNIEEGVIGYRYSKGDRKSYLVGSKLLIDAGCPLTSKQLPLPRIEYLVLTHCHFDHIVYVNKIKELTGCKLASSIRCAQHLREMDEVVLKDRFRQRLGPEYSLIEPCEVDTVLTDGDELGPLQVISAPGHSDGSLAFYHQRAKILFSGDTYFGQQRGRADLPGADASALDSSVHKLKQLDYKLLCPSHGPTKRYQT